MDKEHNPRHQYDCENCKFNWQCGLACSCVWKSLPSAPEDIKLDRVRAFLNEGDRFIKDRKSLERYIKGIWNDG